MAALKLSRKKYSQQELRRIMSETKAAKQQQHLDGGVKRIDSPLAKYNDLGQLTCVLCRSIVRSDAVWRVHINSKQHKEKVEIAKQIKEQSSRPTMISNADLVTIVKDVPLKRPAPAQTIEDSLVTVKKSKGILKKSQLPHGKAPDSVEDYNDHQSVIRKELVNIKLPEKHREQVELMEHNEAQKETAPTASSEEEKLPEGFFDDPKMDAKVRNQEYKDPNDEEWEKFQKEIKEATTVSMAIISEEQEESTAERQIAEIEEQIRNWSRVLCLEKKKELVQSMKVTLASKPSSFEDATKPLSEEDEDNDEFDEFLDWRAKKSYK